VVSLTHWLSLPPPSPRAYPWYTFLLLKRSAGVVYYTVTCGVTLHRWFLQYRENPADVTTSAHGVSALHRMHERCYIEALPFLCLLRGIAGGDEISRPQNQQIICRIERGPILINHTNFTSTPKRGRGVGGENPFTSEFHTSQSAHLQSWRIKWLQKDLFLTQFFPDICKNLY
jgi:hypothetical protein